MEEAPVLVELLKVRRESAGGCNPTKEVLLSKEGNSGVLGLIGGFMSGSGGSP